MPRVKIQDLPQDQTISKDELKQIKGGVILNPTFSITNYYGKIESPSDSFLKISADPTFDALKM